MKFRTVITSLAMFLLLLGCVSSAVGTKEDGNGLREKVGLVSLRFYTADSKGVENQYRVYNTKFNKNAVDYIWYELLVENRTMKNSTLLLKEQWYDGKSLLLSSEEKTLSLPVGKKHLEYSAGISQNWGNGTYLVRLYQDSLKLAEKEFTIY
ncbi:MAG: hypothetical protein JXR69_06995 [Candidatus Delongbacteria bacterium]|nr:hypothetical protein [Candidatus Delongbacteria bacterium]